MKFLIASPDWQLNSGGVLALHRLCHNLNVNGETAYMGCAKKNNEWLGETAPTINDVATLFDKENDVVVYPEIVRGNPMGFKNVVRWILNTPGMMNAGVGGNPDTSESWKYSDLIFKYAKRFLHPKKFEVAGELRAMDVRLDFWQNYNRERNGTCHLFRKVYNKKKDQHPEDSLRIDGYNDVAFREFFNSKERFICYDSECFTAVQAALCGIEVVVIPDVFGSTAEEWRAGFPYFQKGIAYGFDDLDHAKKTLPNVRQNMAVLEKETILLTSKFVETCKQNFIL